jgi:photosystem II stability/assembly factor-like uncharacterized protein
MLNAQAGWAWSNTGRLLQTADEGNTWVDRTPKGFNILILAPFSTHRLVGCRSSCKTATALGYYTTDGGQSWAEYPQGPPSGLHFMDALNGWAVSGDLGAGNVYFSLFQTNDGGKTWAPIPVKPQSPEPGLTTGTIHLCNICNDSFYYDPRRLIIVYGDLGSMEPTGSVQMQVSFDLGSTWQTHNLPLPQGEADALVSPNQPVFFDDQNGLLPVHLLKMNPDGSYAEQRMVLYATTDGGVSWSLLPGKLEAVPMFSSIQVDSSHDVYIICGNALCTSHDRARTWQTVSSDLDFTTTDTRSVSALNFVDSNTGWVLVLITRRPAFIRPQTGASVGTCLHPTWFLPLRQR